MGVFHSKQGEVLDDPLDFGPLEPQGLYSTNDTVDYDVKLVKRLMKEGRLAPFYQGYCECDQPNIHIGSQVDLLTSASSRLFSTANTYSSSNMLVMSARRMGLFLARHIPENVQNYVLYKDTVECPICFMYYPPFINHTRCCDKLICTECFLQLKRSADSPSSAIPCPFCVQSHLGVIRVPPPWSLHFSTFNKRRADFLQYQRIGKRKRLHIFDPDVVLVDHVRPDWQETLISPSRNESSNGTTRRAIVRPVRPLTTNSRPSSDRLSPVNSIDGFHDESVIMEYLRSLPNLPQDACEKEP